MSGIHADESKVTVAREERHAGRRTAESGKSRIGRVYAAARDRIPDSALTIFVAVASTLIAGTLAAQVSSSGASEPSAARAAVGEPRHDVSTAGAQSPLQQAAVPPMAPPNEEPEAAAAPDVPAADPAGSIAVPEGIARPFAIGPTYGGIVTSDFGPRWGQFHYGLDIAAPLGAAVLAVTDGVVLESGPASGFGLWVRVSQDDGTIGVYGHVDRSLVTAGQHVKAGEMIATVGNRGHSTGPHLHYEVRKTDGTPISPRHWLAQRGVWIN
ncbi:M23 family metallopeptidase [Hoyosella sp. YIM 151337]|uniref:M23 family metallopeptidase n=1 Tax=Hoyosella sp. YIM 151337 TaxID=2992742 RepID=UPI0022356ECE|nr:M23 family metallopeptidase [Hoyosella sp. YIM 151337]MCW4352245.1 M23 family metallopeptidase [Hoyosella sp. YIM 151337]